VTEQEKKEKTGMFKLGRVEVEFYQSRYLHGYGR
jgi:hypothetical protein